MEKGDKQFSKRKAFKDLLAQNLENLMTKHIHFDNLQMSEYLKCNKSITISITIFSVREH